MKQEINPKDTSRAVAFELWMKSPMPMVTLTKTFDVTRLYKVCRRRGLKFNMLLCWCIGKAASRIEEFYMLPQNGKLYKYDRLAINVIVNNCNGGINSCDVPYCDDLEKFNRDYTALTQSASSSCQSTFVDDAMVIGTSAMTATELDSIVNQYTDQFVLQPDGDVGPLSQEVAKSHPSHLVPVPSCTDGRWPRSTFFRRTAKGH